MDFQKQFETYIQQVESGLDSYLPAPATRPARIHEAMHYSLQAGGKRLRPVLVLAAADLGQTTISPLPAAVAVECIHTYSLIHDDLPAMDNSDLRRGRPACHIQFDEATAILAGDALLTYAFQLLSKEYEGDPKLALHLIQTLGNASGSEKLIGGQMEDILNEGKKCDEETLQFIHTNKTAALITSSLVMGAHLGHVPLQDLQKIREIGHQLGIAFQVIDDILDATSDTETMGKAVGQDDKNEKNTYVRLHGLKKSREVAANMTASAIELARQLNGDSSFLVALIQHMGSRIH